MNTFRFGMIFRRKGVAMSLDDKLKNYAKYQLDYERAASNRKVLLRLAIVASAAVVLIIIYLLGI